MRYWDRVAAELRFLNKPLNDLFKYSGINVPEYIPFDYSKILPNIEQDVKIAGLLGCSSYYLSNLNFPEYAEPNYEMENFSDYEWNFLYDLDRVPESFQKVLINGMKECILSYRKYLRNTKARNAKRKR